MTFITQPKTEGETKECDSCGMDLVGRLTDYKGRYPDKLQWQDKDSRKAHYDKDGNCNDIAPKETQTESTQEKPSVKNHPDFLENDKKDSIKRKALLLWQIRCYIESTIKELEVNPNGGMIWQMTEIIYHELYSEKKK